VFLTEDLSAQTLNLIAASRPKNLAGSRIAWAVFRPGARPFRAAESMGIRCPGTSTRTSGLPVLPLHGKDGKPSETKDRAHSSLRLAHLATRENGSGAVKLLRAADRWSGDRVPNCFARRAVGCTRPNPLANRGTIACRPLSFCFRNSYLRGFLRLEIQVKNCAFSDDK